MNKAYVGPQSSAAKAGKPRARKREAPPAEPFPAISYPNEVRLLDELNEANKERYKRWLRTRTLVQEHLGGSTLLIGVRGKDGVVLGADTKVVRGGETDFETKIRQFTVGKASITFAGAGVVGVIDDFIEIFEKTLAENIKGGKITSLLSIKIIAEDLVDRAEQRYGPKLGQPPLHFILGGLSDLEKGRATLYEIGSGGFGQKVKYVTLVGHGSPYARTISKYLFPRETKAGHVPLACAQVVPRIAFCVYWIREEVDDYVGGEAQVICVLDDNPQVVTGRYNKAKVAAEVERVKRTLTSINFGRAV
jgi:20S proteasome alpha/beta subunit